MPRARWFAAMAFLLATSPAGAERCAQGSVTEQVLCRAEQATEAGNTAACTQASDARVRDQCLGVYAVRTGRPAACRAIDGDSRREDSLRQICLSDVAIVTGDGALCGEIDHDGLRDTCLLKLYRDTRDAGLCERISAPSLRDLCGR